jgi:hypothetical protein
MKIIYKEIAELTGKTEAGIKKMKINNPEQLEILKMGALCKKYNISLNDLEKVVKEKEETKEL